MRNLIAAIQFLTILPIGKSEIFDPHKMIPFFPVVGILLGGILAVSDQIFLRLWPQPVVAMLDVIVLILLTGAFHLDGLGDTADGLYGKRPKEKALAIMKDSRLGTMGLVAIICGLAVKWGGILSLDIHRSIVLLIIPAYARSSMLFGVRFLRYARPEGGTGHDFFRNTLTPYHFSAVLIPVLLSLFLGWRGIWLNVAFITLTAIIIIYYKNRIGGITGDMLGAMNEILESVLFLTVSIGGTLC
ncbi:MAG: adenosylcobinamide-GDP ribazoletransferase [Desulfobacterales bacterium]|nr:adenosylcobinamide-GDP ribazoletransferase [Desulfobacterales bacterium]